nr:MurR/RpiR family transcriptional regulator [Maliibacterium massiliense]
MVENATPRILLQIKAALPSMNEALKKVALFYLGQDLRESAQMGIKEVAAHSGVSDSTVTRFVREIGITSFKMLQMEFALACYNNGEPQEFPVYTSITGEDSLKSICKKIVAHNLMGIRDSLSLLDEDQLRGATNLACRAKRLLFFGEGRSAIAAKSAQQRFFRLGINAHLYVDRSEQVIATEYLTPEDLVVGVSVSGLVQSTVDAVRRAKEKGARVVAVTSSRHTPLTDLADYVLYTAAEIGKTMEHSFSTVAQMVVLDCFYMAVFARMGTKVRTQIANTARAMREDKLILPAQAAK